MRNYPSVPRKPVVDTYFGIPVEDPYRYLEDKNSEETLKVVAEENAYTKAFFDAQPVFHASEFEARIRAQEKPHAFSSICEASGVCCAAREVEGGLREIVTLNDDMTIKEIIATDETFEDRMHVYSAEPCPNHPGVFAILAVKHGAPRCCAVIYDANGKENLGELDDTFGFSWSPDGNALLYSDAEIDAANNRNINRVRRYLWQERKLETLYTHEENAVFIDVHFAPDGGFFFEVMVSYDDILVLYQSADGKTVRLNRGIGACRYLGTAQGKAFFKTNVEAPMSRIISLPLEGLVVENALLDRYAIALPEGDSLLSAAGVLPDGLLVLQEKDAASALSIFDFDGNLVKSLALPSAYGNVTVTASESLHLSDAGRIFMSFESFTMTPSPLVFDLKSRSVSIMSQQEQDTSDIQVDQCFLPARDGQRILVYLVRPKDLVPNGNTPVLMYGYGGYAVSSLPWSVDLVTGQNIVEWVRMGRIYAHCILRGGMEYGTSWHEAAMKGNKKNAFYDFIDIAEYLIQAGWTKPSKLVATGLSNGGLLMTAITTLRPDLFGTVIASVPHTDMLRFRNDDRGMMYITEYGDPRGSEEQFQYMLSYSPYHNIRSGVVYPRIYVQTGEMDNNVPPYHGKKFAVRLQHEADEKHPVLLQVLAHGSHDRGTGDEYYLNIAQMQAFIEISLAEEA